MDGQNWPCPKCTFSNVARNKKCEICNVAKPTVATAVTVAATAAAAAAFPEEPAAAAPTGSRPDGIYQSNLQKKADKPKEKVLPKGKVANTSLADLHRERMARNAASGGAAGPSVQPVKVQTYTPASKAASVSKSISNFFGFGGSSSSSKPKPSSQRARTGARIKTIGDLPKPVARSG